jgi:CubicO group peptidase (beta-lactamase class C family)
MIRTLRRRCVVACLLVMTHCTPLPQPVGTPAATRQVSQVNRRALEQRLAQQFATTTPRSKGAVVIGVFDGSSTTVVGFGRRSPDDLRAPDEHTVFAVGSLTKVFTGLVLATEVVRGRLRLEDPATRYLPDTPLPSHPNGPIRLVDLATYRSGLPVMPANWTIEHPETYTEAMWREFLGGYVLAYAPGQGFQYGNVGHGVLGDALAAREALKLADLYRTVIFRPLGMDRSFVLGERPTETNVAQGYDEEGAALPLHFGAVVGGRDQTIQSGCCAVESTAHDLLRFLAANIDPRGSSEMRAALEMTLERRCQGEGGYADRDVGLGWLIDRNDPGLAEKSGIMGGYRAAMMLDRRRRVGVVVLGADRGFPAEVLAREARQAVLVERDRPALPIVQQLPSDATPSHVAWDTDLRLRGWSAPSTAKRGTKVRVRYFYEAAAKIDADYTIFVHAQTEGKRVHADHIPTVPTSEWPVGPLIEDLVDIDIPKEHPVGIMTVYSGLYREARMKVRRAGEVSDGRDRVVGPRILVQ